MASTVDAPDWSTTPAPVDDGATRHLMGARVPSPSGGAPCCRTARAHRGGSRVPPWPSAGVDLLLVDQPGDHLRVLVGGIVVEDDLDELAGPDSHIADEQESPSGLNRQSSSTS
jgi:hypothetical protein